MLSIEAEKPIMNIINICIDLKPSYWRTHKERGQRIEIERSYLYYNRLSKKIEQGR